MSQDHIKKEINEILDQFPAIALERLLSLLQNIQNSAPELLLVEGYVGEMLAGEKGIFKKLTNGFTDDDGLFNKT